ncbi:transcription-repair coupling factor [Rhodoblastus sp.]|jgi:transcription-repair coupling factor (superfamily II helicase)|uniref:transcription-repair coupling factor n=1 Tax=Rhodoblastus sp. TaxID=1962975 RepID=UPI0025D84DE1|nr:transcription-repair coupling factor [Rhodoblastus sp.]
MHDLHRACAELEKGRSLILSRAPEGFDAFVAADLARGLAKAGEGRSCALVHVARDSQRLRAFRDALTFAAPDAEILEFPAWDCQPYDRVSPNGAVAAERMTALARLARTRSSFEKPRLLLTTVAALAQRVPPRKDMAAKSFSATPGAAVDLHELAAWLEANGFMRASTVRESGEYALRGGIVDLYPPSLPAPVRLDFFGDVLETIRAFDPESQRTTAQLRALDLVPVNEAPILTETIKRFRQSYIAHFGAQTRGDALYEAVSEGRRPAGLEHWLPLLYDKLDSLFDYIDDAPLLLDAQAEAAAGERFDQIKDYYEARRSVYARDPAHCNYKPLPPDELYLSADEFKAALARAATARFTPFAAPEGATTLIDCGGVAGRNFAPERNDENANVFQAAVDHIRALQGEGKKVIVAGWTDGSRERLGSVLAEHGLKKQEIVSSLSQALSLRDARAALAVIGLEAGFVAGDLAVIGEQDILGDRLAPQRKRRKRAENFLAEVSALSAGDLVVHVDHGIGRFVGLKQIEAAGAPHDCLELHYHAGDKLFVPVENIELLSRYGSEDNEVTLDRLGHSAWRERKARLKLRIRNMAQGLIKIAAARALHEAPRLTPPEGLYEEFCARFPYDETEDQLGAIESTLMDMASGKPMDRLICGDVGFGKTEVALRAAFTAAINGVQVALVVPTTLLARQHFKNFSARFAGLPVRLAQMSRMVGTADMKAARAGAADGTIDIVIGTHAVLGKTVGFKNLGLVIIDEEQHFGVGHKERLKEMRAAVHVLTLSATPIPRTLQLALTGVRELSIIATPPVDRLAVRTFVTPFDDLILREALLRERFRGGQSFFVCPRLEDLDDVAAWLRQNTPEARFTIAHGQMAATELEERIGAFYDGKYDVLVSTNIVESGLDIPTANTLIVYRSDMFGLAQLYQLRGRVGRSKTRAYAFFTTPLNRTVTPQAQKRLEVLQSLDTLGAGFQLASHDLDLRGAGNLLGDEQSGHIREVGYELYQQMLNETIAALKAGGGEAVEETWSPLITLGTPVTIPEHYVEDLDLRLQLYRRLATLDDEAEIESFAAEMIDRFGPMPDEVKQLMVLVGVKALCRRAHVEKLEAGPKGIIIGFRNNSFANPAGLVRFIARQGSEAKVRPDMKIVFIGEFERAADRLSGARAIMRELVAIAEKKG